MRLNSWVLVASLAVGLAGVWFLVGAVVQYQDAVRAYTRVQAVYVPDSFAWRDPSFEHASVDLDLVNHADVAVTVERLSLGLYFDGRYAGTNYEQWQPPTLEPGARQRVTLPLQVTAVDIMARGAEAHLTLRGRINLNFETIERPFDVAVYADIGQAARVES